MRNTPNTSEEFHKIFLALRNVRRIEAFALGSWPFPRILNWNAQNLPESGRFFGKKRRKPAQNLKKSRKIFGDLWSYCGDSATTAQNFSRLITTLWCFQFDSTTCARKVCRILRDLWRYQSDSTTTRPKVCRKIPVVWRYGGDSSTTRPKLAKLFVRLWRCRRHSATTWKKNRNLLPHFSRKFAEFRHFTAISDRLRSSLPRLPQLWRTNENFRSFRPLLSEKCDA